MNHKDLTKKQIDDYKYLVSILNDKLNSRIYKSSK